MKLEGERISMDYILLKLLKDKKVADSYQYYESSSYKLYLADITYRALENVVNGYLESEKIHVSNVWNNALTSGIGTFVSKDNSVEYFGMKINPAVAMDKLTMEVLSLLHNFYDNYAQWINSALFGERAIDISKVSIKSLINILPSFPEYTGKFIDDLKKLVSSDEYTYIEDFNNTLKHRRQIFTNNKIDILTIDGEVIIPKFEKDGRPHDRAEVLQKLKCLLTYSEQWLKNSYDYIKDFYENNECGYVAHRFYNPETYLVYRTSEDALQMKNVYEHYVFIEVDPMNILDEYHIMLSCDGMNDPAYRRVDCYNSDYSIIVLREVGNDIPIGILKPVDGTVIKTSDEHELYYRKYKSYTNNFRKELATFINGEAPFNMHSFLTKTTTIVLNENE